MTNDLDIWKRLADSGLLTGAQVASIRTGFDDEYGESSAGEPGVDQILDWLANKKRISDYQRQVLLRGRAGPFLFDDYLVHSCDREGPLQGTFRARHVGTGHPVRLFFFGGSTVADARLWQEGRRLARLWKPLHHPLLGRIYESLADGPYRFVVSDLPRGKTMLEKFPRKSRVAWPEASQAIEQLAVGLQAIHAGRITHGRLSPASVWIGKSGVCRILPPLPQILWSEPGFLAGGSEAGNTEGGETNGKHNGNLRRYLTPARRAREAAVTRADDLFSLGQIAVRLICGKVKTMRATDFDGRLEELKVLEAAWEKYEVPDPLKAVITGCLTADVSPQAPSAETVKAMMNSIVGSNSMIADVDPPADTQEDYQAAIDQRNRSSRFFDELQDRLDQGPVAAEPAPSPRPSIDFATLDSGEPVISASQRIDRRRNRNRQRKSTRWILASSVLLPAILIGVIVSGWGRSADRTSRAEPDSRVVEAGSTAQPDPAPDPGAGKAGVPETGAEAAGAAAAGPEPPPVSSNWLRQSIEPGIADLAWESPTAGPPLDARWLPPAPEIIFHWHPQRSQSETPLALARRALGPDFEELLDRWETLSGLPVEGLDSLTLSLHPEGGRYRVFVNAVPARPLDRDTLLESPDDRQPATPPSENTELYQLGDLQLGLVLSPGEQPRIERVLVGESDLVNRLYQGGGLAACDRYLADLLRRSDRQRDLSVLFLNSALTSEEGTTFFSGPRRELRRPLDLFFHEQVRAVLFSAHHERGNYLELMTAQTVDLRDEEAAADLRKRLEKAAGEFSGWLTEQDVHPYWQPVGQRASAMVDEVLGNLRIAAEPDGLIANCWLPENALHNLIAVGELSLANRRFERGDAETVRSGPQDLSELLATRRTLELKNPPDLRVLLESLQQEIRDDFPDLPFEFTIRLSGDDLQQEGITQNQRPGDISMESRPLSEVLTAIMFQANPDKDAESPADPRCKLIWVVADDPAQPDRQIVLITTRAAADSKNLQLPEAFQTE